MTGIVGWRENCEKMCRVFVISLSFESPFWAKMNLDTRAVADTLPSNFGPARTGDGCFTTEFQVVKFRNFKSTMKTVFPGFRMEDS